MEPSEIKLGIQHFRDLPGGEKNPDGTRKPNVKRFVANAIINENHLSITREGFIKKNTRSPVFLVDIERDEQGLFLCASAAMKQLNDDQIQLIKNMAYDPVTNHNVLVEPTAELANAKYEIGYLNHNRRCSQAHFGRLIKAFVEETDRQMILPDEVVGLVVKENEKSNKFQVWADMGSESPREVRFNTVTNPHDEHPPAPVITQSTIAAKQVKSAYSENILNVFKWNKNGYLKVAERRIRGS